MSLNIMSVSLDSELGSYIYGHIIEGKLLKDMKYEEKVTQVTRDGT